MKIRHSIAAVAGLVAIGIFASPSAHAANVKIICMEPSPDCEHCLKISNLTWGICLPV